jgi:hypothetical protein
MTKLEECQLTNVEILIKLENSQERIFINTTTTGWQVENENFHKVS